MRLSYQKQKKKIVEIPTRRLQKRNKQTKKNNNYNNSSGSKNIEIKKYADSLGFCRVYICRINDSIEAAVVAVIFGFCFIYFHSLSHFSRQFCDLLQCIITHTQFISP